MDVLYNILQKIYIYKCVEIRHEGENFWVWNRYEEGQFRKIHEIIREKMVQLRLKGFRSIMATGKPAATTALTNPDEQTDFPSSVILIALLFAKIVYVLHRKMLLVCVLIYPCSHRVKKWSTPDLSSAHCLMFGWKRKRKCNLYTVGMCVCVFFLSSEKSHYN